MNHIIINQDIHKAFASFFVGRNYSNVLVIADEHTNNLCYSRLELKKSLPPHEVFEIKSGETEKNLATCTLIWQKMTDMELDRKALVINIGGGVIGDMGGFCASTYKRGIDFVQVPTTLLSMVDASVGGKLGIDFNGYKNHIGVFQVPASVIVSNRFLETLPHAELKSGYAEVIKHCLIADKAKWDDLTSHDWQKIDFQEIVQHSITIKDQITTEDPTEKGRRKILNFGHTLGHAVETFFLETPNRLLHGEAIAVGMVCESYLSFLKKLISLEDLDQIMNYLIKVYGKVYLPIEKFEEIIKITRQDKKNEFDNVQFALLGPVGHCSYGINISEGEMKEALDYYNQLG
ncbi:MAG: 3-dehydroquinate synthase [Opitutaceae bacterium]|nr:3-dehydroquinate synthase [Cytophagales bacterium]